MNYSAEWHPKARKFLRKLPADVSQRIIIKIREVQENPFRYLEHYEGADHYKLRIGDYRLLVDVDIKNKVLLVQVIGHRGNIYKQPQ